jgi:hypothetical protein
MFKFYELILPKEKSIVNKVIIAYSFANLLDFVLIMVLPLLISNLVNFNSEIINIVEKYFFYFFNYNYLDKITKTKILLVIFLFLSFLKLFFSIIVIDKVSDLYLYFKKKLTYRVAKKYFLKDYIFLKNQNKPDFVRDVVQNTDIVLINSFIPLVNLIGDLVAAIPIVLLIIILEIKLFLFLGILIAILFILYDKFIKKKFIQIGKDKNRFEILRQRYTSDIFSSIIPILSGNSFEEYIKKPLAATVLAAKKDKKIYFAQILTKHLIEFISVFVISCVYLFSLLFFNDGKEESTRVREA